MKMEPSHLVPQSLTIDQFYPHPLNSQYQNISCFNPVPGQPQQTTPPYVSAQTIIPPQGGSEVQTKQLPFSQGNFTDRSQHALGQNLALGLGQETQSPLIMHHQSGFLHPSHHSSSLATGLTSECRQSRSHKQPRPRGPQDQPVRPSPELTTHRSREAHLLQDSQGLRSLSQNRESHGQTNELSCSPVVMARHTKDDSLEAASHLQQIDPTTRPCPVVLQPVTPSSNQGLFFRPGANSNDINFIRKLRQKERRFGRNWKSKERISGKRPQQCMEDDSCNLPAFKQFISEEKMAAQMSNLSIGSDNEMATLHKRWLKNQAQAKRQLEEIESRLSDSESEVESDSESKEARGDSSVRQLEVSPELKKALRQQEGLLPDSVVKSISNTCTQLVLWKPPTSYIISPSSLQDRTCQDKSDVQLNHSVHVAGSVSPVSCTAEMEARHMEDVPSEIARPVSWGSTPHPAASTNQLFDSVDDDMDL